METIVIRLRTQKGKRDYLCILDDTGKSWTMTLYRGDKITYAVCSTTIIGCLYNCALKINKLGELLAITESPISVMLQGYLNMIEEKEILNLIEHRRAS